MSAEIQKMLEEIQGARDLWNGVAEWWRTSGLPVDIPYARLYGASFEQFNKRVMATLELVAAVEKADEVAQLMFMPKVKTATAQIKAIQTHSQPILNLFKAHPTGIHKDAANTLDSVAVHVNGSAVIANNIGQYIDQINNSVTALYDLASTGLRIGKARGLSIYLAYGNQLQELAGEIKALHSEITKLKGESVQLNSQASESAEAAEKSRNETVEAEEAATAAVAKIKDALAEAEAKLSLIKNAATAAESVESQVAAYEISFNEFQASLDARIKSHEQFENNMSAAMAENKKREDGIDVLIDKADTMIRGATTAGLSKSLDEARLAYEERLHRTGWWFLGSVGLLLICLLPIAGQLVPGPWQEWFKPVADANSDPWLATLGKIILLLPATWATAFFASNYAELFHLSREYAHKAAMAKAVDGFKREAPEYKEEIVAGVFMEIRENPGSRKSPEPATPQNPIVQRILEKLLDAIKSKKDGTA